MRNRSVAGVLAEKGLGLGLSRGQPVARLTARERRCLFISSLFFGFCLVCLALLHVWLRLQVVHLGYVLSTGSKLQNQLEQENRELRLELATLTSRDRIEIEARRRLGLAEPQKNQVVILP
ncbi:MAG: cell division protein FtsL [Deltaproteobacteria bacterium]|nr:cell division protein FtsL [Deltaproteobacteria bacterium]